MKLVQVKETDRERLFHLHKQALGPYIDRIFGWDETEQERLFNARFNPAASKWIEVGNVKVGVIKYRDHGNHLTIDNIAIYPHYQNQGFGSTAINRVFAEAGQRGVHVDLQVFKINPAARLYKRLGFVNTGETERHFQMRWTPIPDGTDV